MVPYLSEIYGNAGSRNHAYGWEAQAAVENAREQVANMLGGDPKEIVFTSGATESDNLAILGVARFYKDKGRHIITVATEHKAVLDSCKQLEREGFRLTCLGVGSDGLVDLQALADAMTEHTILVSVMTANNEIGVLQPIKEIAAIAHGRGVLVHTDAVQAIGKIPFSVVETGVDMASLTAHKIYGPKGVGALFVRKADPKIDLEPLIDGGGHERGLRSGTLNVPGIVGFGKAAEIAAAEVSGEASRVGALRDRLLDGLRTRVPDLRVNGSMTHRVPHNLNVSFPDVVGESLLLGISDICVSAGSACSSGSEEPPYVLKALGLDPDLARASIRFGLGRPTTLDEIDYTVGKVADVVHQLQATTR
jgi:cysteine desulfurase